MLEKRKFIRKGVFTHLEELKLPYNTTSSVVVLYLAAKSDFGAVSVEFPLLLRSLICDGQVPHVRREKVAEESTEFSVPHYLHSAKIKQKITPLILKIRIL